MTTAEIIAGVLDREGAEYTDDPVDRGGATRWGITQDTLSEWRGKPVSKDAVAALTRAEAAEIYEHLYLVRSGFLHLVDERLRVLVLDWAVNSGIGTATKALQRVLGVPVDGVCGPVTLSAANTSDPTAVLKQLGRQRQQFYVSIVKRDPEQIRFLAGWLGRNWSVAVDPL